jgi:glycogen debranching enzyme
VLTVLEGNTFLQADDRGDVGRGSEGVFHDDTRYLSRWRLLVNGVPPQLLTSRTVEHHAATVYLQNPPLPGIPAGSVSLIREQFVGEGNLQERLVVQNHAMFTVALDLRLEFGADFLDLFEVKARAYQHEELVFTDTTEPPIDVRRTYHPDERSWELAVETPRFRAKTLVWSSQDGTASDDAIEHTVALRPGERWESRTHVVLLARDEERRPSYDAGFFDRERDRVGRSLARWRQRLPAVETDWEDLRLAVDRSIDDLAALRMHIRDDGTTLGDLPAAGLPWFMTVFGRDTLITSLQTLVMGPELALGSLETLAALQSTAHSDAHDAEPGKIVHEVRVGRVAAEGGSFPYYGSVDATLLFLILLSEVYRWTGDPEPVQRLRPHAMAALRWMREEADLLGNGYVAYHRRSQTGLESQTWKDSWDSMRFADGTIARTPIAACEVQGYAYDARLRCAELARAVWGDEVLAGELEAEAAALQERFLADFWVEADGPGGGYYALGLDRERRQIDALSSNIGHLLWSGIIPADRVAAVADHLLGDDLFTGWGVRTLSRRTGGYNPIGYHTGTVWPHDNSLIVAGLCRHGHREQANRITTALIEAARHFGYRLPEVFAGFGRSFTPFPVEYPTACSPQAWAAGAPILCLTELLGLRPDPGTRTLRAEAVLPEACSRLAVRGVTAFGRRHAVVAEGATTSVEPTDG